jgi:chloramphenicol-sensitive protein RarD
VVVAVVLGINRRLGGLRRLGGTALLRLSVAGIVIALNWGAYIWGVNSGQVVQTSLGYFINPLVTVALSVVVLRETLRPVQWAALGLGLFAVGVLTVDYGHPPWLALLLACSFGFYGLIKSQVRATPPEGLFVEAAVMTLPALGVLVALAVMGQATWIGSQAGPGHLALLAAAGPVTAVPLLLFAAAARSLPLSTVGMLQYLAPTIQFLIGVLVRHEPMPPARLAGFALVWLALAVLTADALRHRRKRGRAALPVVTPA